MDTSTSFSFLKSLWSGISLSNSTCCHCSKPISSDRILARTFALQSQRPASSSHAEAISVPSLSETLLIYHRHLECLFSCETDFIVISHVWHPPVSILQYTESAEGLDVDQVAQIVREEPTRIALGLRFTFDAGVDIWHDYISVPQWQSDLKSKIVGAIPRIFKEAKTTVAFLSDVDVDNIRAMREGKTVEERCWGISRICNARWFSRVWTAMEHTQSKQVRAMFASYEFVEDFGVKIPIIHELVQAWNAEVKQKGNAQETEILVGMGNNLVPWQLGPLELVRWQNQISKKTHFAMAHELLARRCVTIPFDFFIGLLHILKPDLKEKIAGAEMKEGLLQVARSCMAGGDFSPLFIIPASARVSPTEDHVRSCGYIDLVSFALGAETMPPTFREIKFRDGNPIIQAENIGTVQFIKRVADGRRSPLSTLTTLLRMCLESTGLDVDAVVNTVGTRFYGQHNVRILEHLSEGKRRQDLQDWLRMLYDTYDADSEQIASRIADVMGLSNTALNPASSLSPMKFLSAHGGGLHLGRCNVVANITCAKCQKDFLIRVALLKPGSQLLGVKAYRIPGLKYDFTHPGGAGFLLENGRIVGRFLWGTPTCECEKLEEVEVLLDDLPLPRPNNIEYGKETGRKWYPIFTEQQIRIVAEGKY